MRLIYTSLIFGILIPIPGCSRCECDTNQLCQNVEELKIGLIQAQEIAHKVAIEKHRDPLLYNLTSNRDRCYYWFLFEAKESVSGMPDFGDPKHFGIRVSGLNGAATLFKGK